MATLKRILLVEDHEDSARSLARILSGNGHKVRIAASLEQAREAAAAEPFDLMICDIGLPDGDGSDLMREFAAKYSFPGIALTGYGMPGEIDRSKEAGFASVVIKPVEFDKFLTIMQDVVNGGSQA